MTKFSSHSLRTVGIPVGTLCLLLAIYAFGGIGQSRSAGAPQYFDEIAAQIDDVPYMIGSWVGVNLPYTDVEVQMLRPNKILQRTYQNQTTGQKASLSIVHCTDIRDMSGHFPPVCYPAHGWDFDSSQPIEISVGGTSQQARVYFFSRSNQGVREVIRIVSFFIVPNADGILADMKTLDQAAKNPQAAGLGAAQVQILTPASQSPETTNEMVSKIIEVVEPVIDTIEQGAK